MSSRVAVVRGASFSRRACSTLSAASKLAGYTGMCVALLVLIAPVIHAQDVAGITVSGAAKASAKPTSVEIPCVVSGDAELTADAIVKYRDARKRAIDAVEGLKINGLSIDSKGYSVRDFVDNAAQQQAMMRGQVVANTKQKVSVTEQLKIVIKDIDKMEQPALMDTMLKVLDTARDSGLTLSDGSTRNYNYGSPMPQVSLINFKVNDTSSVREEAYKKAMEDAKTKAQKLADLAGVKLGRILSVRDGASSSRNNSNPNENPAPVSQNELTSSVYDEIPLTVSLTVQFEILK